MSPTKTNQKNNSINMECPLCDKEHLVKEMKRIATIEIKGIQVQYEEIYYECDNCKDGENEFVYGKTNDLNLLNARNAYRKKKDLLTSHEIVDIRKQYGLSQVEMSRLLGWGEATISRYESKAIQDEAYDNILREIRENPFKAYEYLNKYKYKFNDTRIAEIKDRIQDNMNSIGKEYLKRRNLQSEYIVFQEPSKFNGYQELNIDKLESLVSRLALYKETLYKMQLMKELWYVDNMAFRENGKSITGLVYQGSNDGIIPLGCNSIIDLENVIVKEEVDGENIKYRIETNDMVDMSCLSDEEIKVVDKVREGLQYHNGKEMIEVIRSEKEYMDIKDGDIIPFV